MRSRLGGFINKTTQPSNAAATGVWALDECRHWTSSAKWPVRSFSVLASSTFIDVSGGPKTIEGYIDSGYASVAIRWERRGDNSSLWSTIPNETLPTIRVSNGGFFYRMIATSGIKTASSPEIEVVQYQLVDFQWLQHPPPMAEMELGRLFYLQAIGRAVRADTGAEYYLSEMECQWETRLGTNQAWTEMEGKTDSVLWLVSGGEGAENGRRYRLRVTGPMGVVYSNASQLVVI